MTEAVPDYVAARICEEPPEDCEVVRGSTPVVSFGDVRASRVATVGLNPSRIEFEVKGVELDGAQRRFETTQSLGISSLVEAPAKAVEAIFWRCNDGHESTLSTSPESGCWAVWAVRGQ
jgi:hypothetical protein